MSRSGSPHHFTQYNSTLHGQIFITLASNLFPSVQLLSEVSDESQSGDGDALAATEPHQQEVRGIMPRCACASKEDGIR